MTSAQLAPAIFLPLVAWRIYVRVRRNVGRQRLEPKRLKMRVIIFAIIIAIITAAAAAYPKALGALAGGVVASFALAWVGLRLTTFERMPEGNYYTPNTVVGVGLSLLLVGRIAYRFIVLYQATSDGGVPTTPAFGSAITLAIIGLTFGYYVAYSAGILARAKHIDRQPVNS
jgi:hypothetical protein